LVRYEDGRVRYETTELEEITLAIALKYADTRERCSGLRARLAGGPAGEIRSSG
jgi:hypothetical protein